MGAEQKHQALFAQLVIMFHAATMQHLGKVKNPLTDRIERDLTAAQGSIDVLDMLQEKTKGNLNEEENRLLTQVLKELKLNYVDEVNKPVPEPPSQEEGEKGQ